MVKNACLARKDGNSAEETGRDAILRGQIHFHI
jgi:hypothetical protein